MGKETRAFPTGGERPFLHYQRENRSETEWKEVSFYMHDYTKEDILRMVEEEDVAFIRLQFTDIFGTMKNMAV